MARKSPTVPPKAPKRSGEADSKEALELRKLRAETERAELRLERARQKADAEDAEASANLIYTFYNEVNDESVKECIDELGTWSRQSPKEPITVILNSPGGNVVDGLALYDYLMHLRKRGHHITMIVLGEAASMGGVLLQAGNKRIIGRHAFLMIHQISWEAYGKSFEHDDVRHLIKRQEQNLLRILAQRSTLSAREVGVRWHRKDWWLNADEAVKLGFADEIL